MRKCSVWCLLCVVCLCCYVLLFMCVLFVWCCGVWHTGKTLVCRFKTSPCVPAPRAHVLPHAGVVPVYTGNVLNAHTGGERGETKEQERSSSVLLTKICARRVIKFFRGSPKETFGSYPFSSLRIGREQQFPDSSNHSLYLIKLLNSSSLVGNFGECATSTHTQPQHTATQHATPHQHKHIQHGDRER